MGERKRENDREKERQKKTVCIEAGCGADEGEIGEIGGGKCPVGGGALYNRK